MKILVLGASGMLGNAVFRFLAKSPCHEVFASVRSFEALRLLPNNLHKNVIVRVDVENLDCLTRLFDTIHPDMVINCIGLVKQVAAASDPLSAILINALYPHRLARLCDVAGSRLVHMSTDCVFSGAKGMYVESDYADANELYGRSKYLGEVDYPHTITLRTSIIGHELNGARSLVNWFLAQKDLVKGYKRVVFSGLPTVEIARVIRDYIIPHPELHGVYHVSAEPINKFDLLTMVAQTYEKNVEVIADDQFSLDRSLDSTRFRQATNFSPKPWRDLLQTMRDFS